MNIEMRSSMFLRLLVLSIIVQSNSNPLKTTAPVSLVLDGLTLKTWFERSLWNSTQISIVHHLNRLCRKDFQCEAEYGIGNVHLLDVIENGAASIRLNFTADQPILSSKQVASTYNYTGLLTEALFQTKLEMEHIHQNRYSSSASDPLLINRLNRLLFVFLGITLVALIFGLTVCFFQRIRQHRYSKLYKSTRTCPVGSDEPIDRNLT